MYNHTRGTCMVAAAFLETGRLAISNVRVARGRNEPTVSTNMAIAGITNLAFAFEIAIKAFLPMNHPKTHNLKELFDLLKDDEKRAIINAVILDFQTRKNKDRSEAANLECDFNSLPPEKQSEEIRSEIKALVDAANTPPLCDSEEKFYELLEQCKDNFKEVRYIHEGVKHSFNMPFGFMDSATRQLLVMAGLDYNSIGEEFQFQFID